jgi:serine/threonine protein kinase
LFDLIHADIKPANIIMAGKGRVKLSDFGLARTRKSGEHSENATLAGTPQYVAPELIRGEGFSIQSDMYALGITLFELVFGHPAIALMGESIELKLASHLSEPVQFPSEPRHSESKLNRASPPEPLAKRVYSVSEEFAK